MNIVDTIRKEGEKGKDFDFGVGDTIRISVKIIEGDTERIQHSRSYTVVIL